MVLPMQGVPSALIARNESWVRKQAQALVRHLPANVEKADLIQVGLIAVAQAALSFEWEGDRDTEEAKEAFVRYARMRVKGAMLDELRQMDHLGRGQRRKVKIIQIARERWRATNGGEPTLAQLSKVCGISVDEISALEMLDQAGRTRSSSGPDSDFDEPHHEFHPATEKEEVEARVDTSIVMRHLEKFFAQLPERDRQVIDSYLGVGMTPVELAASLKVTPSRVSQLYKSVLQRISNHFGHPGQHRVVDRVPAVAAKHFDELVQQREKELEASPTDGPWGELIENVLTKPKEQFGAPPGDERISVSSTTRWG
ncbi:sigma-70 family RNA polymerase sigma factor [Azohydromonas caseinilytica]|uniref:Sigma-70 family RNA polymerase sigma factor n=1 Tax=Azohydromonas caseinilytica TaxID=2728836 RepID=A0A848F6P4_9BURK|nr:sigma-70 family RNA polymerase sigma factor [Azohydromonas caseinilytica]NML14376.1 sigma-70 family RNA polymerase sigma factor [Azohydromonas caseinilytica]